MCRQEWKPLLGQILDALIPDITHGQKQLLAEYTELLLEGIKKQRLIGGKTGREIVLKHIYDSLYPLTVWEPEDRSILDLGTGAGLPGIPLKVCRPDTELYLMDANRRKMIFLRRVVGCLGLQGVTFLNDRAENIGQSEEFREHFNQIVSRAVAPMDVMAELALPLLRVGGRLLLYKGKMGLKEAARSERALLLCGGALEKSWEYHLQGGEGRTLLLIRKSGPTPPEYPRPPGRPSKKPLR